MNIRIKSLFIIALILSCLSLTSCNTVRGFGYDVQNTGRAITSTTH